MNVFIALVIAACLGWVVWICLCASVMEGFETVDIEFTQQDLAYQMDERPVDMVFTWVDASATDWNVRKEAAMVSEGILQSSECVGRSRFNNSEDDDPAEELTMAIELALRNCPWLRNIIVVCFQGQVPAFFTEQSHRLFSACQSGRVKSVSHAEIGIAQDVFNSHAIEAHLHQIPGLSQQFIYCNDDFYVCRAVPRKAFFSDQGKPVCRVNVFPSIAVYVFQKLNLATSAWWNLDRLLGNAAIPVVDHCPLPLTIDIMRLAQERFDKDWKRTSTSVFRSSSDIPPIGAAVSLSLYERNSVAVRKDTAVRLTQTDGLNIARFRAANPHFFCNNDKVVGDTDVLRAHLDMVE